MKFKVYDIVSNLVPGFLLYIAYLELFNESFNKDYVIPATAIAYVTGYFINTISSWLEDIYFFTWRGKPSNKLLDGRDMWKVKFYDYQKATDLLKQESGKDEPSNDELFQIASRYATPEVNSRVQDFNTNYAFSRVILTTAIIIGTAIIIDCPNDVLRYVYVIPIIILAWYRSKQRGYYFAREVLNTYIKSKSDNT